ncbi:MAG: hypothetical protein ACK4NY_03305 [Spirosomataceae bacterium]
MKKVTILLLIIIISCKKESTVFDSFTNNKFTLKSITYKSDKLTYTEDIFYDKNWRIIKVKNQWQEYNIEYNKNEISKINFKNGEGSGVYEISYGKVGTINSTYTTNFENKTYFSKANFELNDKKQIIRFSDEIIKLNISYDNLGNIVQIANDENTFELKNNAFDTNYNPYAYHYQNWLLLSFLRNKYENTISINNPISSTIRYSNNSKININFLNFQFDENKNLIALKTQNDSNRDEYEMLFTYVSIE